MLQAHCGTRVQKLQQEMPDVELNKKWEIRNEKVGRTEDPEAPTISD
jgi:hypothetical protein